MTTEPEPTGLYVHVDLDVLDAGVARVNRYAADGGVSAEELEASVRALLADERVRAVSLTAYEPELDPAKDVEIVNQRMAEAVTSFISGAVPAVALWVPFNVTVRDKVAGAKKLVDASAYYPQAAIVSGWAASNDFHAKNREVLQRVDLDGTPPKEAASALGLTFNNLNVRLHRARQRLRERVEATCRLCSKHGCLDCSCGSESGH